MVAKAGSWDTSKLSIYFSHDSHKMMVHIMYGVETTNFHKRDKRGCSTLHANRNL
jgi:DUF1365 family protein